MCTHRTRTHTGPSPLTLGPQRVLRLVELAIPKFSSLHGEHTRVSPSPPHPGGGCWWRREDVVVTRVPRADLLAELK